MNNKRIKFVRIKGKIVPLTVASSAGAAAIYARKNIKKGTLNGPDKRFVAASYATQVASGIISALPMPNKFGYALSVGSSFGLDALAASLTYKSVKNMKGSKYKKAKEFAKQQAVGGAIGWGTFGAALLANKSFRTKALGYISKLKGFVL